MTLQDYHRINTRKASILTLGGSRPTGNPLATHFGFKPVHLPGETWPFFQDKPLFFICQLNLAECPFVPDVLRGIAIINFFLANTDLSKLNNESGQEWILRCYSSPEGLVPMDVPAGRTFKQGFEGIWKLVDDQPVYDDSDIVIPQGFNPNNIHLDNIKATKAGGYASNIQSEQWWGHSDHPADPRFCFQIASEPKVSLEWGDGGVMYFARGTAPGSEQRWFLDWQCY